jgi:ABC-2 type transport system permease protein
MGTTLPDPKAEIRLVGAMRRELLFNQGVDLWQTNRLRLLIVVILTIVLWFMIFGLFLGGFEQLRRTITHSGTLALTVHAIFNVFFLSLLIMICMSSGVLYFSNAYRGRDVPLLLTLPLRIRRVVIMKLEESILFSGWGFFLLGSPVLLAYGIAMRAPWFFYVVFPFFMLAFVTLAVALGTLACLILLRVLPNYRRTALLFGAIFILGLMGTLGYSVFREATQNDPFSLEWLQRILARLRYSEQRWLPSWWLSSGLIEAAHAKHDNIRAIGECLGFFSVLASSAYAGVLATAWLGDRLFLQGYSELSEISSEGNTKPMVRPTQPIWAPSWIVPREIALLVWKDLCIFRRDMVQWSQFAVFFGLLVFYFLNVRRLQYGGQLAMSLVLISTLNVAVVGLLLATFTTRFVYPLLSLEGRRFWVLGTSPISRGDIVWSKFVFAVGLSLLPCALLVFLSDLMLGVPDLSFGLVLVHQLASAANCLGLSALSVGLGARFPHLKAGSAAKIATGFGGTLTLVSSIVLIFLVAGASGIPIFLWIRGGMQRSQLPGGIPPLFVLSGVLTTLIGIGTTIVSIRTGLRSFERFEP